MSPPGSLSTEEDDEKYFVQHCSKSGHYLPDFRPVRDNHLHEVKDFAVQTQEWKDCKLSNKQEKQARKSPDKVLAYGVLTKEGKLEDTTTDRAYARVLKAILGGKREGVTIVVLQAGKEIR